MKKHTFLYQLFFILCLLFSGITFAQTDALLFKNVKTLDDANTYVEHNNEASFLKLSNSNLDSDLEKRLYNFVSKNEFEVYTIEDSQYKFVGTESETKFKVSYIYFNGKTMSLAKINSLRPKVIQEYKSGVPFESLVQKYSMDGNATGDLGWISLGETVEKFEKTVLSHKKGEIFTADVPENNWYYVVLKTEDDQKFETFTFLVQPKP